LFCTFRGTTSVTETAPSKGPPLFLIYP